MLVAGANIEVHTEIIKDYVIRIERLLDYRNCYEKYAVICSIDSRQFADRLCGMTDALARLQVALFPGWKTAPLNAEHKALDAE